MNDPIDTAIGRTLTKLAQVRRGKLPVLRLGETRLQTAAMSPCSKNTAARPMDLPVMLPGESTATRPGIRLPA
jgi:hypothetical protein